MMIVMIVLYIIIVGFATVLFKALLRWGTVFAVLNTHWYKPITNEQLPHILYSHHISRWNK